MRRFILTLAMATVSVLFIGMMHTNAKKLPRMKPAKSFVEGELIVKFRDYLTESDRENKLYRKGHRKLSKLRNGKSLHVMIDRNKTVEEALAELRLDPDVELVQPNFIYRADATTPNDTNYGLLWGLKNTGQSIPDPAYTPAYGTSGNDMDMELVWDEITDCSTVIVAVTDTGVNYNHEDLENVMWQGAVNHGYDFIDSDNDPMDFSGHGTHVAGTIGAEGNNATGNTGVCWNLQIMAVRVLGTNGSGTTVSLANGIDYAVANGASIINLSLSSSGYDTTFYNAAVNAKDNGVLMIAAAGNDGADNESSPRYPCNFTLDNIICVAALDQNYYLASFSNWGTSAVDVGAPGTNVHSSWPGPESTSTDDFNTSGTLDWSTAGDAEWDYANLGDGYLVNPPDFDYGAANYANNQNSRVYKEFPLTGDEVRVELGYHLLLDSQAGVDLFSPAYMTGTGDPFSGGTILDTLSGLNSGYPNGTMYWYDYILEDCMGETTCSVGFRFTSNASNTDRGIAIGNLELAALTLGTSSYNVINGTSMATPHVAGLAAIIQAYNPNYTYTETRNNIINAGESTASLSGKTVSGKAVNGWNSLKHINAPTGVSAVVN